MVSYTKIKEIRPKIVAAFSPLPFELRTPSIAEAYRWGQELHAGQLRMSGEPYFETHCVWVAAFIDRLAHNEVWTIAALLHDSIEDRGGSLDSIKAHFPGELGERVAYLVDGMTKLSTPGVWSREVETLRKIARFRDPGVFLVKLADKTHNLMTLEHMPHNKQVKKATEAIRAYGKLAGILNCYEWRRYLEDLAFPYMDPENYKAVRLMLDADPRFNTDFINNVQDEFARIMAQEGIEGHVAITVNGYWQSWQKLRRMARERRTSMNNFGNVNDILSFRLVVHSNNEKDCYSLLPAVNRYLGPYLDQNRFDDYIAAPQNGYQALQVTARLPGYGAIEAAIVTEQMEGVNSWGIVYALQNNLDVSGYHPVEILTPTGGVRFVQEDSTVLDAIAAIQQDFWLDKIGRVEVNGMMAKLSDRVKPGDVVEIITDPVPQEPTEEWLNYSNPSTAPLVRQVLANKGLQRSAVEGRRLLEPVLREHGILNLEDMLVLQPELMNNVLGALGTISLDDLYIAVGAGAVRLQDVSNHLTNHKLSKDALGWTSINIIGSKESNTPGVLAALATIISNAGGNIMRAVSNSNPDGSFYLRLVISNIQPDHMAELAEQFKQSGVHYLTLDLV